MDSSQGREDSITGKRDSIHHHLLETISETANVLELKQKLLYTIPSGWWWWWWWWLWWWWCIESVFRMMHHARGESHGGALPSCFFAPKTMNTDTPGYHKPMYFYWQNPRTHPPFHDCCVQLLSGQTEIHAQVADPVSGRLSLPGFELLTPARTPSFSASTLARSTLFSPPYTMHLFLLDAAVGSGRVKNGPRLAHFGCVTI